MPQSVASGQAERSGGSCHCQGMGRRDVPALPAPARATAAGVPSQGGRLLCPDRRWLCSCSVGWQHLLVSITAALCELSPRAQPALSAPHSEPSQSPPCSQGCSPCQGVVKEALVLPPHLPAWDTSETGITLDPHLLLNYQRGY